MISKSYTLTLSLSLSFLVSLSLSFSLSQSPPERAPPSKSETSCKIFLCLHFIGATISATNQIYLFKLLPVKFFAIFENFPLFPQKRGPLCALTPQLIRNTSAPNQCQKVFCQQPDQMTHVWSDGVAPFSPAHHEMDESQKKSKFSKFNREKFSNSLLIH